MVLGWPRYITIEELYVQVRSVEWHPCKDICTLAKKIGMPKSTLHDAMKRGILWTTKSHIKPMLTEPNKAACVDYCLGNVQDNCFKSMFTDQHEVHTHAWQETSPSCMRAQSHIPKAMCLTVVACPCPNSVTGDWWDVKIGSGFFVEQVPVVRSSCNQPQGTIETRRVNVMKVLIWTNLNQKTDWKWN